MSPPQVCPGELAAEEGSHRVPHLPLSCPAPSLCRDSEESSVCSVVFLTHTSEHRHGNSLFPSRLETRIYSNCKPTFHSVPSASQHHQNPTKNRRNKSQRQTDPRAAPESTPVGAKLMESKSLTDPTLRVFE
ncbi:hypothetical protein KUCAC02_032639 [Chaenocephalus aceratus]|nr:hypothetical protein KUCAC02_032639 [Chaenocephalus aceratus]